MNGPHSFDYPLIPRCKLEFARLFCNSSFSDKACLRWLRSEIACSPQLQSDLQQLGYSKNNKMLTIAQQLTIYKHITASLLGY